MKKEIEKGKREREEERQREKEEYSERKFVRKRERVTQGNIL